MRLEKFTRFRILLTKEDTSSYFTGSFNKSCSQAAKNLNAPSP